MFPSPRRQMSQCPLTFIFWIACKCMHSHYLTFMQIAILQYLFITSCSEYQMLYCKPKHHSYLFISFALQSSQILFQPIPLSKREVQWKQHSSSFSPPVSHWSHFLCFTSRYRFWPKQSTDLIPVRLIYSCPSKCFMSAGVHTGNTSATLETKALHTWTFDWWDFPS